MQRDISGNNHITGTGNCSTELVVLVATTVINSKRSLTTGRIVQLYVGGGHISIRIITTSMRFCICYTINVTAYASKHDFTTGCNPFVEIKLAIFRRNTAFIIRNIGEIKGSCPS